MAGLEDLIPLIYHETQQAGSMLCAQHALNSLLQGNYFTAPDLSEFARRLDDLEQSYNEDIRGHASANMDDTGFFSVQVLENALHVWGLSLTRWRSERMKPYQDQPQTQLAFVLNQNQHWYTLRRFGGLEGNSHWFNLDSCKPSPQWVSKTYLGMFLQQAETDGYSIFAVTPADPSNLQPLPLTDADDVASTLPEPSSASTMSSSRPKPPSSDFEDEDMDLQAALQASLADPVQGSNAGSSGAFNRVESYPSPIIPTSRTFPGFPPALAPSTRANTGGSQLSIPPNQDPYGNADVDPVRASMERNRVIMERMRQQQEAALREQYDDEIEQFEEQYSRRRQEADEEADEEAELIRRTMERSLVDHHPHGGEDVVDDEEEDYYTPPTRINVHSTDRVYDDDDAQLQAALKASLETMPPGFTLPPSPQPAPPQRLTDVHPTETNVSQVVEDSETETETETETEPEGVSGETVQPAREEVSIEEMRRRRLARFGG